MSNVAIAEIFEIVAKSYGVTVEDMIRNRRGRPKKSDLSFEARACALSMALRHTNAPASQFAAFFKRHNSKTPCRLKKQAREFDARHSFNLIVHVAMLEIEDHIDDLHESRIPRDPMKGFEGLRALPKSIKRGTRNATPKAGQAAPSHQQMALAPSRNASGEHRQGKEIKDKIQGDTPWQRTIN